MSSPTSRRSSRPRQRTKKYDASDAFADDDDFNDPARLSPEKSNDPSVTNQDNDSDIFVGDASTPDNAQIQELDGNDAQRSIHSSDDSDDMDMPDANNNDDNTNINEDDEENDDDDDEDDDNEDDDDDSIDDNEPRSHSKAGSNRRGRGKDDPTRGLVASESRSSKSGTKLGIFGPALADQEPATRASYKWKYDLCLPTRKADRGGFGGFNNGFYRSKLQYQQEIDTAWRWYDNSPSPDQPSGKERLRTRQAFTVLTEHQARDYLPKTENTPIHIVSGPFADQKLHALRPYGAMHLDTAFITPSAHGETSPDKAHGRHGWYINAGQRVQCLDWATNQSGPYQTLALATMPSRAPPGTSPFVPRPAKSWIQLWTFKAGSQGHIDSSVSPRLSLGICTDWGHVRSIKWCPVPRAEQTDSSAVHLGLLAGVWTDGSVRVLDLDLPDGDPSKSTFRHYSRASFVAKPPHGVYTSIAWLSSVALIVGCSDGTISIFDVPASLNHDARHSSPMMHIPVQASYILDLTTCYPSRPHIVCTASMSGLISMTDLLEVTPTSALSSTHTVPSARSRIGNKTVAWHDFGQSIITTDDNGAVYAIPLRRFFATTGVGLGPSNCIAHAVSPTHPFMAMGHSGGEAIFTDPLKRLMDAKSKIWCQTWFTHEFRPDHIPDTATFHNDNLAQPSSDDEDEQDAASPGHQDSLKTNATGEPRSGKVRVLEGFRTERVHLNRMRRHRARLQVPTTMTLYEPESAVTVLAWNPNVHVGGWCAAGMASGMLRVEDIARDRE